MAVGVGGAVVALERYVGFRQGEPGLEVLGVLPEMLGQLRHPGLHRRVVDGLAPLGLAFGEGLAG